MGYFIFALVLSVVFIVLFSFCADDNTDAVTDVILSSMVCCILMFTGGVSLWNDIIDKEPKIIDYVRGDAVEEYTIKTDKSGDTISIDTTFVWKVKN